MLALGSQEDEECGHLRAGAEQFLHQHLAHEAGGARDEHRLVAVELWDGGHREAVSGVRSPPVGVSRRSAAPHPNRNHRAAGPPTTAGRRRRAADAAEPRAQPPRDVTVEHAGPAAHGPSAGGE